MWCPGIVLGKYVCRRRRGAAVPFHHQWVLHLTTVAVLVGIQTWALASDSGLSDRGRTTCFSPILFSFEWEKEILFVIRIQEIGYGFGSGRIVCDFGGGHELDVAFRGACIVGHL